MVNDAENINCRLLQVKNALISSSSDDLMTFVHSHDDFSMASPAADQFSHRVHPSIHFPIFRQPYPNQQQAGGGQVNEHKPPIR